MRGLFRLRFPWLLLPAMLASGCPGGSDDDDTAAPAALDLDADTDRDGTLDGSAAEDEIEDTHPGAVALTNIDDDNSEGNPDCGEDERCAGENDLTRVVLQPAFLAELGDGAEVELELDGDPQRFRVHLGDEAVLGLTQDGEFVETHVTLDDLAGTEPTFEVEGLDFYTAATLTVRAEDPEGVEHEDTVALSTPPFLLLSNLDPGETLYVLHDDQLNKRMRDGLKDAVGEENVVELQGSAYGWDVWIQDEVEFGYQQSPTGPMRLVLDSIRDRGLDDFPEDEVLGPDFGWLERGSGPANSLDSFGNLECTPPVTAGGVDYPLGRIYYGGLAGVERMTGELRAFLDEQQLQAPVELDSTWLLVGHVDEFMAFIPDPDSAKGYKLLIVDWDVTRAILEGLDPRMAIPQFEEAYGISRIGDLLDPSLYAYNEDVQLLHLDPLRERVMEEFGLTDDDIIPLPGVWEEAWNAAVALVPGMVNLAVYDHHLLIADPFLRTIDEDLDGNGVMTSWGEDVNGNGVFDTDEDANGNRVLDDGEDINGNGVLDTEEDADGDGLMGPDEDLNGNGLLDTYRDPFIAYMEQNMPAGVELHFLDDWRDYHLMEGEVHCGTNIVRTPRSDVFWWEVE